MQRDEEGRLPVFIAHERQLGVARQDSADELRIEATLHSVLEERGVRVPTIAQMDH